MFLRWRRRKRSNPFFDVHWAAVLVEGARVNGRQTQRHIAYLGGITESAIRDDNQRRHFWNYVYEQLDGLSDRMSIDDRRHIEATIAAKVPRLSREEYDKAVARYNAVLG